MVIAQVSTQWIGSAIQGFRELFKGREKAADEKPGCEALKPADPARGWREEFIQQALSTPDSEPKIRSYEALEKSLQKKHSNQACSPEARALAGKQADVVHNVLGELDQHRRQKGN